MFTLVFDGDAQTSITAEAAARVINAEPHPPRVTARHGRAVVHLTLAPAVIIGPAMQRRDDTVRQLANEGARL